MKLKILSAFTVGLLTGLGIGAAFTAWTHRRELNPGVRVERLGNSEGGAVYRVKTGE